LGGRKQRALLAVLLLHANEVVSRDRLIDELWGDVPPKSAADIVRVFVSRLRKALEPHAAGNGAYRILQTRPAGYVLAVEADQLDVQIFESRLAEAGHLRATGDSAAAAEFFREALTLWRGPPLADFTYEPFAQSEIARLEELRLAVVEERIDADLACARHADLVVELESLVREEPGRERLRGQLMLALYRSGRQADALEVYRRTRQTLVEELGIEPTPALRELEAAILRQDSNLDPPSSALPTPPPADTRKTVTVVGTSLTATRSDGQRLDPEARRRLRRRWRDVVARAAREHGGIAENVAGEAAIAVFGIPRVHEDDAIRALRTADDLRQALSSFGELATTGAGARLEVGIGIASEEVIVGSSAESALVDAEVVGMSIHIAELAGRHEVILDDTTRQRAGKGIGVELLPPLTVKGRREPVTVWRLVGTAGTRSSVVHRLDAPMVGRDRELEELRGSLRRVSARTTAELVTVVGEAGIGKSRLAHELGTAVAGEARVVVGRCLPYGEGITFWPLREIVDAAGGGLSPERLRDLLGGQEDADLVVAAVRGALGLVATPAASGETFWGFRRLFERLAEPRPLVAVFEDVHWAEPTLLDLIEHLADTLTTSPVLFLCLARSELLEERPGWGGESATIQLEPLADSDTEALVAALAGGSFPHRGGAPQIAERAEGNPLFVEQIVAMIADAETIDVDQAVPPTIQALLAARLDRLGPGERAVVERAAVVGREFAEDWVIELLPADARPHGVRYVDALVRKQFVRRSKPVAGERRLRFRHVLIQDVAYRAIPKEARADLHERVGTRLERTTAADALDEIIGYHLEHAFRYRAELGDQDWELARRAAEFLGASGKRALLTGDAPAAVNLLSRATSLTPRGDPARLVLLLDLAEGLTQAGELAQADEALAETAEAAKASGNLAAALCADVARAPLQARLGDPATDPARLRLVKAAIAALERLDDRAGLVVAWRAFGELESTRARARTAFTHALRHAEAVGDEREQAELRIAIGKTMIFDATPVDEGIRTIEHNLAWARSKGFRKAEGECLGGLAHLYAMAGRFSRARALAAQQKRIFEDLGQRFMAARFAFAIGSVEILADDLPAAELEFCAGYELFADMGEQSQSLTFAAMIARVVYDQGRYEEAQLWAEAAAAATESNAPVRTRPWLSRTVHAKLLARGGELERAEALARTALADHDASDEIEEHAVMLMDLAEILVLADRPDDAVPVVEQATRLYDRKGHLVSARKTRAFMQQLASARSTTGAR
jgi:DNA-binding SARP family transcriptional activator/tetratricopeptide (TPR) repeat protein